MELRIGFLGGRDCICVPCACGLDQLAPCRSRVVGEFFFSLYPLITSLCCALHDFETRKKDISSYILARTLGVVDDVKASTSDKETAHEAKVPPMIRVQDFDEDVSFGELAQTFADPECSLGCTADNRSSDKLLATSQTTQPTIFYAGGDDHSNLKLSGIEVFSPAGSQSPSPTISRQRLAFDGKEQLRNRLQHVEKDGE